jgi:hypothetical protein
LKRYRAVQGALLTTTAIALATPATAGAQGLGAGLGPAVFTVQQLINGASGDPRVIMKDDSSALVAFATFDAIPPA